MSMQLVDMTECPCCNCIVDSDRYESHVLSHEAEVFVQHMCPSCDANFDDFEQFVEHLSAVHKDESLEVTI